MALEIVWTKRAIDGYHSIIIYLETHWTDREIQKFLLQSNDFFKILSEYPEMLQKTGK
ncbi:MAG: hypothetical protein O2887_16285 [Bacteroidetes bacterium]|nr:hypothetical protein [Bacteroidota bacterium]